MLSRRVMVRLLRTFIFYFFVFESTLCVARLIFKPDADLENQTYRGESSLNRKYPHPYLGFTSDDFTPIDFEKLVDRDKHFILKISGGSVARDVCRHSRHRPTLQTRLGEKLKKKVLLNCLAVDSYSQPQQTLAGILYARGSDFYLSIEGVNELFDSKDPLTPSFPNYRYRKLFFSDFHESFWSRNGLYLVSRAEIWSCEKRHWWDHLSTMTFIKSILRKASRVYVQKMFDGIDKPVDLSVRLDVWKHGLEDLQSVMSSRKIPYLVILQPQVFDRPNKTDREKQVIRDMQIGFIPWRNQCFDGARNMFKSVPQLRWSDWTANRVLLEKVEFMDDRHFTENSSDFFSESIAYAVLQELDR